MAAAVSDNGNDKEAQMDPKSTSTSTRTTATASTSSTTTKSSTAEGTQEPSFMISSDSERPPTKTRTKKTSSKSSSSRGTSSGTSSSNGIKKQTSNRRLAGGSNSHKTSRERRESSRVTNTPNPKRGSLTKQTSRRRASHIAPPQLGGVNPVATGSHEDQARDGVAKNGANPQASSSTNFQEEDGSMRWTTLLPGSPSSVATNFTGESRNILILPPPASTSPADPAQDNNNNNSLSATNGTKQPLNNKNILIADPDAMLAQLLQALGGGGAANSQEQTGSMIADQLHQAMHSLVQRATENGTLVIPGGRNKDASNSNHQTATSSSETQRLDLMQRQLEEMSKQQQQLLDFHQQSLKEKQQLQDTLQQQSQLIQQQASMLEQQQAQLQELTRKVNMNNNTHPKLDQSQQSQPSPGAGGEGRSSSRQRPRPQGSPRKQPQLRRPRSRSPGRGTRSQSPAKTLEEKREADHMLDRLAVFEELEASLRDLELLGQPAREIKSSNSNATESFVLIENPPPHHPQQTPVAVITPRSDDKDDDDEDDSIQSEYDDSEPDLFATKTADKNNKDTSAGESSNNTRTKKDGLVDVWTCPSCQFEHEVTALQFCGVCGTTKPEGDDNNDTTTPEGGAFVIKSPTQSPTSTKAIKARAASPPPAQEPLIQLQLHKELQSKEDNNETPNKDMPPKSPMRRNRYHGRSKSVTEAHLLSTTPKRTRPRMPPRSKTQMDDHLAQRVMGSGTGSSSYHGAPATPKKVRGRNNMENRLAQQVITAASYHGPDSKSDDDEELVIKCLDGDGGGGTAQVMDLEILNQQLSTFDSKPAAAVGAVPTASAPKTPKVNKRRQFRRTRSNNLEETSNPLLPAAPPVTTSRASSVRIPRRAKSNSTDQLRIRQAQLSLVAAPPSPTAAAPEAPAAPAPPVTAPAAPPSPGSNHQPHQHQKRGIFGAAVSAFHKSPKKAITAFKIAGHAMPKSLVGGGGGKDGKNGAFLLDSDDESNGGSDNNHYNKKMLSDDVSPLDAPMTPGRRSSLEARTRASAKSSSGWNKWFKAAPLADEVDPAADDDQPEFDIDDSVHGVDDDDDDNEEAAGGGEDEPVTEGSEEAANNRRRVRRNKSSDRPFERKDPTRASSVRGSGMDRRASARVANDGEEMRSSNRGSNHGKGDARSRLRRTKSLDDDANHHHSGGDANDNVVASDSVRSKPREMGRRRRNTMMERRRAAPDQQDHVDEFVNKTAQMKQRVQGLRKTSGDGPPSTPKPEAMQDDISESTEACSIYLEKSDGDMSEITNPNLF